MKIPVTLHIVAVVRDDQVKLFFGHSRFSDPGGAEMKDFMV